MFISVSVEVVSLKFNGAVSNESAVDEAVGRVFSFANSVEALIALLDVCVVWGLSKVVNEGII